MEKLKLEYHTRMDPLLPFIYHRRICGPMHTLPNWHENLEILCCLDGSSSVKYNEENYTMYAGDILVVNSDIIHHVLESEKLTYHCLIIDSAFCEANGIPITSLYFRELIRDRELFSAFLEISKAYEDYESTGVFYGAAQIRIKVTQLLCLLCRQYLQQNTASSKADNSRVIKKAVKYIRENYTSRLTLEEIAGHAGVSKSYFAREFKKYTGGTVFNTVIRMRCKEAKQKIQAGTSVSDAALSCGFGSLPYFSRAFKRCYKVPPSHYLPK